jgi:hypothetical protein
MATWTRASAATREGAPLASRESGVSFERVNSRTLWDWVASDAQIRDAFTEGMGAVSESDAPPIAAAYPFGSLKTICDVGGGVGAVLAAVLVRHPYFRGILYDDPVMIEKAASYLSRWGVRDRVDLVPGSFMESVPRGADAYLLRLVLHNWDDARALHILRTCRAAMEPGQRLVVVEFVYEPDTIGTLVPYMDIEALALFGARERSPADMAKLFEQAGFRDFRLVRLPAGQGLYEGIASE